MCEGRARTPWWTSPTWTEPGTRTLRSLSRINIHVSSSPLLKQFSLVVIINQSINFYYYFLQIEENWIDISSIIFINRSDLLFDRFIIKLFYILTEEVGQPLGLTVMLHSYADGVEEHENDNEPVEFLRFHGFSYPVPESFLGQPELLARSLLFRRGGSRKA